MTDDRSASNAAKDAADKTGSDKDQSGVEHIVDALDSESHITDAAHLSPCVSVVVPARDLEDYLGATIESVLSQSEPAFELIIIVDGAKDRTADIARRYGDPRIQVKEVTLNGVSKARNLGLSLCSADCVVFLDGDDLLEEDALAAFSTALHDNPAAIAVVGAHSKIDEQGELIDIEKARARSPIPDGDILPGLLQRNIIVNGGAMCIRTHHARQVGGFIETLRYGEDWEFWCRLAALGPFASLGQKSVMRYRQRRTSAFSTQARSPGELDISAIDAIFEIPAVLERFSPNDLKSRKRKAVINNYWASTRTVLYSGHYGRFCYLVVAGLIHYPDSLFQDFLLRFLGRLVGYKPGSRKA